MKGHKVLAGLAVGLLAACSALSPVDPGPDPGPIPSGTPRPSLSPTATATITPSPTTTPTSTPTPTASTTPLPVGYYANHAAGIALVIPTGWEVQEEGRSAITLINERAELFFYLVQEIVEPGLTPEEAIDAGLETVIREQGFVLQDRNEIPLQDGTRLLRYTGNVMRHGGSSMTMQVGVAVRGARQYTLVVLGPQANVSARREEIDGMIASLELAGPRGQVDGQASAIVLLGFDPDPEDLDPARQTGSAGEYVGLLFSGLVRLSPRLQIEPDLAESWDVSPDGRIYTFHLRPELRFQSGRALTAQDVVYSWERASDPQTASTTAGTYLGDIDGVKARLAGEAEAIHGLRVIDDLTLEVTLDGPKPYFLAKLTYPTSFVVDQDNVEAAPEDWMFNPNASGPFILATIDEAERLVFERNPAYHTPAGVEQVVYLLFRSGSPLSLFEAGEIDLTSPSLGDLPRLLEPGDPLHSQLHQATTLCTRLLTLNNTLPPTDDPAVRRALSLSIDRDRILELIYENRHLPAVTILPPAMPGFSRELSAARFSPEAARQALADSAYADGLPEITFLAAGFGDRDNPYIDALVSMWREHLGASVRVEYLDPEGFTRLARQQPGHIVSYGWCADYPDPENFLDILFHSQSDFNVARYTSPVVDSRLEAARTIQEVASRLEAYQQIEARLLEDYAAIPIVHFISYTLVSEDLEGYVEVPMGAPILHRLTRRGGNGGGS